MSRQHHRLPNLRFLRLVACLGLALAGWPAWGADAIRYADSYDGPVDGGPRLSGELPVLGASLQATLTLPAELALDGWTPEVPFQLVAGALEVANWGVTRLGDGALTSNRVVFVEQVQAEDGSSREVSRLTLSRAGNTLSLAGSTSLATVAAEAERGTPGSVSGQVPIYLRLGRLEISRTLYYTGNAILSTVTAGTGEEREQQVVARVTTQGTAEFTAPTVVVLAPAPEARLSNATVLVQARVTDARPGVHAVWFQVNDQEAVAGTPAGADPLWSALLPLAAGTNHLRVTAADLDGNVSVPVVRRVFGVVRQPLVLSVRGEGTVTGLTNGQVLEVNRGYTLTAVPRPGHLFSNWTGGLVAATPRLGFLMRSNLSLTAWFVTNPFPRIQGTYAGLFQRPGQVRLGQAGPVSLTLRDRGAYSAVLRLQGRSLPWSGQFDLDGRSTQRVLRPGASALRVQLQLDLTDPDGRVAGTVAEEGGGWEAGLLAHRAFLQARPRPAPMAGRYSLRLPGGSDPARLPAGDGIGSVTVGSDGVASLTGWLADGTPMTLRAGVSAGGAWPFHVTLYGGRGLAQGWLTFAGGSGAADLAGDWTWEKSGTAGGVFYPGGFLQETQAQGWRYVAPTGTTTRAVALTNGVLEWAGGNLPAPGFFTNTVLWLSNNTVQSVAPASNRLSVAVTPASALFQGTVVVPGTSPARLQPFRGILLQGPRAGTGFFLGTNQTGRLRLSPLDP